jgi:hypothetical protein
VADVSAVEIRQRHVLVATSVATGAPKLDDPRAVVTSVLRAGDVVAGAPDFGRPSIRQRHELGAEPIATGKPSLAYPVLRQSHRLVPLGIAAGIPIFDAPTLREQAPGADHVLAFTVAIRTTPLSVIAKSGVARIDANASFNSAPDAVTITTGERRIEAKGGVAKSIQTQGSI